MSSVTPKSINASDNSAHRIERPTFVPGDYWISENWRDSNETKERNKIIFLKEEGGYFLFDNGKGETLYTDFNLTPMKKTRGKTNEVIWEKGFFEYPGPALNFPLEIGKQWEQPYEENATRLGANAKKMSDKMVAKYSVTAYEKITVTAGTFEAFKIECQRYSESGKASSSDVFWYAPSIKKVVSYARRNNHFELLEYLIQ